MTRLWSYPLLALLLSCRRSAEPAEPGARPRLERDVAMVAKLRPPGSPGWRQVQDLCAGRLSALGYRVERRNYGTGINVVGIKTGSTDPGRQVIVSAHYDHIAGCAGADDNASGVAAVLELARRLASKSGRRTLVIAFWDEEERGLVGSGAYADEARARGDDIAVALSLDAVGYRSSKPGSQRVPDGFGQLFPDAQAQLSARKATADFLALVASPSARAASDALAEHARRLGLPLLSLTVTPDRALALPDTLRSDHASFWRAGFPALLLTDTGDFRNPRYHCRQGPDLASSIDLDFLSRIADVVSSAVGALIDSPG